MPIKTLLFRSLVYTLAMWLIWLLLNHILTGQVWEGMLISKSALVVEYCEFNHTNRFFHQSSNTYSNLIYFFLGVLICHIAQYDYQNSKLENVSKLQRFPMLSALMGFCFVYLSFGSAFFHASLTWLGQRIDMNGTYSISITLLGIGLYHILYKSEPAKRIKKYWIFTLVFIILAFVQIHLWVSSSLLIPILVLFQLIFILLYYFINKQKNSLFLGIFSFVLLVIALKIRTLDVQKIGCNPHSFFQGHSVWHLLTGLSSFCSYCFYRFSKQIKLPIV